MIFDPACEALVASASKEGIVQDGLPLDKFDFALIPGSLPSEIADFIRKHCSQADYLEHGQPLSESMQKTLNDLVLRYRSNLAGSPHSRFTSATSN
ncbi:hypothetical protein BOW35_09175 [Solemya velum gill symbiont]|nr:hypothetical protein BOW27_07985 [Solemya velum gill symbiont]OOZ19322.1 hypothetical protein BOW29_07725 [Solemya velum gill symbiont]OOZ21044.1 hypothetical protein BOW30_11565 [Solemya velum gill symbiont]OOZ23887.1 hypothetical protein BOW31_08730 [Solemya velum gill symbiont]OOZ28857.1 hypothetical protein BOW33_08515 [Solemya velum gill symbiont]